MATPENSLVALLRELAQLTVIDEGSPNAFRVRAYENAIEAILTHRGDVAALSERELTVLDGIGKSTAKKIREFFDGGRIARLDELREKYPPGLVALTKIPGLGPKTLRRLKDELGVRDVDDLRAAIEARKVRALKGLGAKAEEKLAAAIGKLGSRGKDQRRPIAQVMPVARELVAALEALPGVGLARYCGSLRRFRETIADVDVVVASDDPGAVVHAFLELPGVGEVIGSGETKTSVLTATGLQLDLRIVAPGQFGAACQYFTGSKAHNIKLRQRALARGWTLNEYGLADAGSGEIIAAETEESIYDALGLAFIPAPMREDHGEIEAAERGDLVEPVAVGALKGDLHVHTSLSGDGRSPLEEVVAAAAEERGYAYLAITDHGEDLAMNGVDREALRAQRRQIDALGEKYPRLTLLHGCELNIGRDGGLDYDADFRSELEWCVAGVHSHFDLDADAQTRRILRAMEDESVNAIAHLTGRRIGRRPGIEIDVDAVLKKAAETGTAIEINAALGRLDASAEVLFRARDTPVTFVVSTDAHQTRELERMQWGVLQAARGWVEPERIANTWPKHRFLRWAREKRANGR